MKKEIVERYVWSKDEVRDLLIEDLTKRGIKVEGENSLSFSDMSAILEIWLPRMPQDETFSGGEGGKAREECKPGQKEDMMDQEQKVTKGGREK